MKSLGNLLLALLTMYQVASNMLVVYVLCLFLWDMYLPFKIFRQDLVFDKHRVITTLAILVIPNAAYGFWKAMRRIKRMVG